eukprot:scaffold145_cov173-Amphora_coffeaeformis.AAC.5
MERQKIVAFSNIVETYNQMSPFEITLPKVFDVNTIGLGGFFSAGDPFCFFLPIAATTFALALPMRLVAHPTRNKSHTKRRTVNLAHMVFGKLSNLQF